MHFVPKIPDDCPLDEQVVLLNGLLLLLRPTYARFKVVRVLFLELGSWNEPTSYAVFAGRVHVLEEPVELSDVLAQGQQRRARQRLGRPPDVIYICRIVSTTEM